jgi:hypothetical protein
MAEAKKDEHTNNDQQNTGQKTKDWAKPDVNPGVPEGKAVPFPLGPGVSVMLLMLIIREGRRRMVFELTTTYTISAYHH